MVPSPGELTLGRWVRDRGITTPERVAIDHLDQITTYAQLDVRSERLAVALTRRGLRPGQRVATVTTNRPEHVELLFACAKAGLLLAPLSPRLTVPELAFQLADADPALVLSDSESAAAVAAATAELDVNVQPLTRDGLDALTDGADGTCGASVHDHDPLLLMYTSGTTGAPKGALLTHANCFWTNLSLDRTADVTTTDVVLAVLPQFHVGGWNVQPLLAWWKGATVVLEPRFDPVRALELIARKRVTAMMGVPATYLFLMEQPGFADADLSSLRTAVVGGAPMPERLLSAWHDRGVSVAQGYGLTEAAPNVLCLPPEHAGDKLGYAGRPYLHVDVALRDPATGAFVDGPGRGELCVRGPNVFAGYWRNDAATHEVLRDGWLRTSDIAERDADGFYRIRDRLSDMYISGGENVSPVEVESVLYEHPDITEAAVVGVADERWGEVGAAFVVARAGAALDPDDVVAHCRTRLASYKVPRHVRVLDALPRSSINKVLKTALRARWEDTA